MRTFFNIIYKIVLLTLWTLLGLNFINWMITPAEAEMPDTPPISDLRATGEAMCYINSGKYMIPCKSFEDDTHSYFALMDLKGKIMIIKRGRKGNMVNVEENWWVAPELRKELKQYELLHSF